MNKLFIVIPAYNEADNIRKTIEDWYPIVKQHDGNGESRLVIVNDGSKDNTAEIVDDCSRSKPLLTLLNEANGGHGSAVLYGYRFAIKNDADYIFQTDSDGQTNPDEFQNFWKLREEYDAVIGNRSTRQDGASRKFVESILLSILWLTFRVKMPDSNAPFRLMSKTIVNKYIGKLPENYNLPNVMFTTYFAYFSEKIKFIDISFKQRQGGTNTINIRKIMSIGVKSIKEFRYLRKHIED